MRPAPRVSLTNVLALAVITAGGLGTIAWTTQPATTPPPATPAPTAPVTPPSPQVLTYTIPDIDGTPRDLAQYKGQVVLITNTASKCGYTWQYRTLEEVYQKYKSQGFVVLAFPSGDFKEQEFADNKDIKAFCTAEDSKYKVTFPLFGRMSVRGKDAHPLFKQLAAQPLPIGGEPTWNFTKWVVNRKGEVIARFDTRVSPDSDQVRAVIEDALKAPRPGAPAPTPAPAPAGG